MFINYKNNGEALTGVSFNGANLFSEYTSKEIKGESTFNVPSLDTIDRPLSDLTIEVQTKDSRRIYDAYVIFKKGSVEANDAEMSPLVNNIDSVYVTVAGREIEYCMLCQGNTITDPKEACLDCGGDGMLV